MYEHRKQALLPRREFFRRLGWSVAAGAALIAFSLSLGMIGYHTLGGLSWIDAFLNASMILAGMGPVDTVRTAPGKLFAGLYAIFSGVIFLTTCAVLLAPAVHRFLHRTHLDIELPADGKPAGPGHKDKPR